MYRRLRDLREDHDLTQKQLAKILSFTNSAYAKIERGEHTLTAYVNSRCIGNSLKLLRCQYRLLIGIDRFS